MKHFTKLTKNEVDLDFLFNWWAYPLMPFYALGFIIVLHLAFFVFIVTDCFMNGYRFLWQRFSEDMCSFNLYQNSMSKMLKLLICWVDINK